MNSIDSIASGTKIVHCPKLRRRIRKTIFRLFLRNAKRAHPLGEAPVWWGTRGGLVAQYSDGGLYGDSRLSNAYFNLVF